MTLWLVTINITKLSQHREKIMATQQPGDRSPRGPRNKKAQDSYLALGIVFLAVGIGMSFGDSSAWVAFLVLGITFLAVSGSMRARGTSRKGKERDETL
ncbi:MAG: hypothetical protein Q4P15_10815 [Propionibacteriaceae bacterium]|nr:hypothetical protein [Propionibacteriaceae bacterium]